MFVVEAVYPFSKLILKEQQAEKEKQDEGQKANDSQQRQEKPEEQPQEEDHSNEQGEAIELIDLKKQQKPNSNKRVRSESQQKQLQVLKQECEKQREQQQAEATEENNKIQYLSMETGDKILVIQAYQNGWWYGNTIKNPQMKGFFPSNYVKTGAKPPPPAPKEEPQQKFEDLSYDRESDEDEKEKRDIEFVRNELGSIKKGPVDSSYYLGVKGYRTVKIDEKNQNILNANNVKFDVNTGMARVPIKDQAPAAKAVRQMGYYFDCHQWTEQRNKNPHAKARPDIRKKKAKKLNLKGMN